MRGVALIALPVMLGPQTMSDVVGKVYHWIGREGTSIEAHNAGVPREVAIPEPGLAVPYCSFDIILADPTPFGHPFVTEGSMINLVVTGKYYRHLH